MKSSLANSRWHRAIVSNRFRRSAKHIQKRLLRTASKSDMVTSLEEGVYTEQPSRLAANLQTL
jgi:hypothetical protein